MGSGPISLKELSEKYNMFTKPEFEVKINGSPVEAHFLDEPITVEITAGYAAGSCQFVMQGEFIYDTSGKIALDEKIGKLVKPGNKVEVSMCYGGTAKTGVFKGYIDGVYMDYDNSQGVHLTVECLDGKGIMMNSLHSETKKGIKKYSEAVAEVLKGYASVLTVKSSGIDKSDPEVNVTIEQHNESDYDFVVRMAKKLNYDFYIVNGEVQFRKISKTEQNVMVQYEISEYIHTFSMLTSMKNKVKSVTVRANNEKDPQAPIQSKVDSYINRPGGSGKAADISNLLTDRVSRTVIDPAVESEAEAKERAQAILSTLSNNVMQGSIVTPGIPELIPGRIAQVKGFGPEFDKKYAVTKVIHQMKQGNFTTTCELEAGKL